MKCLHRRNLPSKSRPKFKLESQVEINKKLNP